MYFALIVNPWNSKSYYPIGFYQAFYQFNTLKFWVLIIHMLD